MSTLTDKSPQPAWQTALDAVTSLAVIVVAVVIIRPHLLPVDRRTSQIPIPSAPISLSDAATRGQRTAQVAILEFADFQCAFCARFATATLPALEEQYINTGKVLLAFQNLPLANIHPFATRAAEVAECARRQGKFWELHDRLYADQQHLAFTDLLKIATAVQVDDAKLATCISSDAPAVIQRHVAYAQNVQIMSTPTFLVGRLQGDGRLLVKQTLTGATPFKEFQVAIDSVLRESM